MWQDLSILLGTVAFIGLVITLWLIFFRDAVMPFSDETAVEILICLKKFSKAEAEAHVRMWRQYATDLFYSGPTVWLVRGGYTLKWHAARDRNSYGKLDHLQDWDLENDEPIKKNTLVFWVPRLVEDARGSTIHQMEAREREIRRHYKLPVPGTTAFGSIALLFAVILASFKYTEERMRLYHFAVSDSFLTDGRRLMAGFFGKDGIFCDGWSGRADRHVGFFLIDIL